MPSTTGSRATLESFNLHFDSENSALICTTCRTAVAPGARLKRHFERPNHRDHLFLPSSSDTPEQIARFTGTNISQDWPTLRGLIKDIKSKVKQPSELAPLPPEQHPHPLLPTYPAMICPCGVVEIDRRKWDRHKTECGRGPLSPCRAQSWIAQKPWFPVGTAGPLFGPSADESTPDEVHTAAVTAFHHLLSQKIKSDSLDATTLLPSKPTPASSSVMDSPWLARVRWPVLLKDIPLPLAVEVITDPTRLFGLLPRQPSSPQPLSAQSIRSEILTLTLSFLLAAFDDLTAHASDDIRIKLHCDQVEVVGFNKARRPLGGKHNYVHDAATTTAQALAFGWTLLTFQLCGAFDDDQVGSELYALRPLLRCLEGVEDVLHDLGRRLQGDVFEDKYIGDALSLLLSQRVQGPGHSSVLLTFSAIQGIDKKANFAFKDGQAHSPFLVRIILGLRLSIWASALASNPRPEGCPASHNDTLETTVDRFRVRYAVATENCVLAKLYGDRNYAMSCQSQSSEAYKLLWNTAGDGFNLNGQPIRLDDFITAAASMEEETIQLGLRLELGKSPLALDLNCAALIDITGNKSVGYSFASESSNSETLSRFAPLASRIAQAIMTSSSPTSGPCPPPPTRSQLPPSLSASTSHNPVPSTSRSSLHSRSRPSLYLLSRSDSGTSSNTDTSTDSDSESDKDTSSDDASDVDSSSARPQPGQGWSLDRDAAAALLRREQAFLRSLFAAIFFTAGPANRGTELASTTIRNTVEQTRDVLIGPEGAVLLDTAHSKTAWRAVRVDRVTRVLPKRLGEALVRYLLGARPALDRVRLLLYGTAPPSLLFVSPNGAPWAATSLGEGVRTATQRHGLGVSLGLLAVRHCQAAICFRWMDKTILDRFLSVRAGDDTDNPHTQEDGDEVSTATDPFFDDVLRTGQALHRLSNHSMATAALHYQDNSEVRRGLGLDRQTSSIMASALWHRMLGLETFRTQAHPVVERITSSSQSLSLAPSLPTPTQVAERKQEGRISSEAIPSSSGQVPSLSSSPSARNTSLPFSTLKIMAQLCGEVVSCKTEGQARALNRISYTQDSFIAVLPTGAGKSLLWQISAKIASKRGQLVGLFLPLVALREDAKRVAGEADISTFSDTEIESAADVPSATEVLIYSLDFVLSEKGTRLLHELLASGRLARVCVDEAHVFFEDTWRRVMSMGWQLGLLEVPLLLLSATIPPSRLADLARAIALDSLAEVRESIQQLPLSYRVHVVDDPSQNKFLGNLDHPVNQLVLHLARLAIEDEEPTIIFAREKGQAVALAEALNCAVYHSVDASAVNAAELRGQMDQELARFIAGLTDMLCGTFALGAGIHRVDVRRAIIAGVPYSLLGAVQAGGRCGRDGEPAHVDVVVSDFEVKSQARDAVVSSTMDSLCLQAFLEGSACRRAPIGRLFDGQHTSCFELHNAQFCDFCEDLFRNLRSIVAFGDLPSTSEPDFSINSGQAVVETVENDEGDDEFGHYLSEFSQVSANAKGKRKFSALSAPPSASQTQADLDRSQKAAKQRTETSSSRVVPRAQLLSSSSSSSGAAKPSSPLPPAGHMRVHTVGISSANNTKVGPFERRNGRASTLAQDLLPRALEFIRKHRALCAFCVLAGNRDIHHQYQSCPDPRMAVWKHKTIKYFAQFSAFTACYRCGLPYDFCKAEASSSGSTYRPITASSCCADSGTPSSANYTVLVAMFALATCHDVFSRAEARVQQVQPMVRFDRPPQSNTKAPDSWLWESERIEGCRTYKAFWLVLAAFGIL
ncbi:hypothetical protein OC845_006387 [Tilletia horrida]|nr:hypothetical protein OC845_006387 [Tilletia horrida]